MKTKYFLPILLIAIASAASADELSDLSQKIALRNKKLNTFKALSYKIETPTIANAAGNIPSGNFGVQVINASNNQEAIVIEFRQVAIIKADNKKTNLMASLVDTCAIIAGTNSKVSFLTTADDATFVDMVFNTIYQLGKVSLTVIANTNYSACVKNVIKEIQKYNSDIKVVNGPTGDNIYIALEGATKELTLAKKPNKKVVIVIKMSG